jgi:hypothetical protein
MLRSFGKEQTQVVITVHIVPTFLAFCIQVLYIKEEKQLSLQYVLNFYSVVLQFTDIQPFIAFRITDSMCTGM